MPRAVVLEVCMGVQVIEQIVIPGADILVSVPCYKDAPMVARCLASLQEPGGQLLLVDNGAESDVKGVLADKGVLIQNPVNQYVNPAWNQAMEWFLDRPGTYDLLVLANSDLLLDAGWADKLRAHRRAHRQEQLLFGDVGSQQSSQGAFFAM